MTDLTISVPEIHCDHCKTSLEAAVGALAGVSEVSVDIPAAVVTVAFDEAAVSRAEIVGAIEGQGYEVPI
ncbi:MAG TPA: heavy-metal-associated domain-containing protein [Acidimicrobiia bacterium]|jgi:copper chaperone